MNNNPVSEVGIINIQPTFVESMMNIDSTLAALPPMSADTMLEQLHRRIYRVAKRNGYKGTFPQFNRILINKERLPARLIKRLTKPLSMLGVSQNDMRRLYPKTVYSLCIVSRIKRGPGKGNLQYFVKGRWCNPITRLV